MRYTILLSCALFLLACSQPEKDCTKEVKEAYLKGVEEGNKKAVDSMLVIMAKKKEVTPKKNDLTKKPTIW